jgi:transcriptional regulator with XRE-family HTH domain
MHLQTLRRKRRMSLAALATKAGYSREYVADSKPGITIRALSTLMELAKALGVPMTAPLE